MLSYFIYPVGFLSFPLCLVSLSLTRSLPHTHSLSATHTHTLSPSLTDTLGAGLSNQGVAIVSEFISSARVMRGALIVNPWRVEEVRE